MNRLIQLGAVLTVLGTSINPAYCNQLNIRITGNNSGPNRLPPTNLDSFVAQSGYNPLIYGDEGKEDIPPIFGFTSTNRINAGINSVNDAGLTTGHGSWMPSAWGADEYLAPPGEWAMTGAGSNGINNNSSYSVYKLNNTDHDSEGVNDDNAAAERQASNQAMAGAQAQVNADRAAVAAQQDNQMNPGDQFSGWNNNAPMTQNYGNNGAAEGNNTMESFPSFYQ